MSLRPIFLSVLLTLLFGAPLHVRAARLGDLPDEEAKKQKPQENNPPPDDGYTPEEKKALVNNLAGDYYQKGVSALQQDKLREARSYFEKVLALSPNNAKAKEKLALINRRLAPPPVPTPTPIPQPKVAEQPKAKPVAKRVSPAKVTPSPIEKKPEVDKEGSDQLYLQALAASQKKDRVTALEYCKQALKLNPDNLQAQRMLDRLSQ